MKYGEVWSRLKLLLDHWFGRCKLNVFMLNLQAITINHRPLNHDSERAQ